MADRVLDEELLKEIGEEICKHFWPSGFHDPDGQARTTQLLLSIERYIPTLLDKLKNV